ncbi:MAG: hypothetical protein U0872_01445 [Planctomycetaceae bacterium]
MLHFKQGKSYVWLWLIFGGVFLGPGILCITLGSIPWSVLTMPVCLAYLLTCELRSGIALDSWWRASYPRGTWQYRALIAWHAAAAVLFLAFLLFMIHLWHQEISVKRLLNPPGDWSVGLAK